MNYPMVKILMLKDWYLQRWIILATFAGGLASLGIIAIGSDGAFFIGLLLLITALVALSGQLAMSAIVGERKEQTLPFVMSLPISYREYTTSKIVGNLLIFVVPWAVMAIGSFALLAFSPKSQGLIPYTAIMATEILVNACLVASVAVITEAQSWTIAAIILGNIGLNGIGYLVAHVNGVARWMWGSSIHWSPAAYALLITEFAIIGLMIGFTFFTQSRKKDFL